MKHGAGHVAGERLLLTSTSHEVAALILTVLHVLTFVPLVLLPAMQDAHLKLGIVVNTSLCLCLMMGAGLFHYLGIVKVRWPGVPGGIHASSLQLVLVNVFLSTRGKSTLPQRSLCCWTPHIPLPRNARTYVAGVSQDAGHLSAGAVCQHDPRGVHAVLLAVRLDQRLPQRRSRHLHLGELNTQCSIYVCGCSTCRQNEPHMLVQVANRVAQAWMRRRAALGRCIRSLLC